MPGSPVVGSCAHCGEERLLKYARRTMCARYKCQLAAATTVAARKAANSSAGDGGHAEKMPVFCYEVLGVYGQRDCDPSKLVGKKRRNELADDDVVLAYLILGRFAEDEDDEGFNDTRWVDLEDLVANLDDDALQPLVTYDKGLAKRMREERKRMRQEAEE